MPRVLGATDRFFETTERKFVLSGCEQCRCLFMDPLPVPERLAGFYPQQYWWNSSTGILNALENAYRRIILRDHLTSVTAAAARLTQVSPVRLLDIGCGSGTLLALLKRRGFQASGFDFSGEAAGVAKANHGLDVTVASSLREAGFAGGAFDLVTLFHVMEHVLDPHGVLAEVRRILQPKGRILVQVPNIESWQARLLGRRWYGLDVPRHVINYSGESIRWLINDCGFRVYRTRHFNLRDNAPALASSLCPSLDPMSRHVRGSGRRESTVLSWTKHALYLAAVAVAYPLAIAEAVAGAGGTVVLEAERV